MPKRRKIPSAADPAVEYITGLLRFGSHLGLERIRALTKALGNPEQKLRFVHVAGTNGKGTVCTMLAAALSAAGYKTGLYTSPSVVQFEERIRINGEMIPADALNREVAKVQSAIQTLLDQGGEHPTEFEVVTALAFSYFAAENCDIVVLETGMGGRFDATNAIEAPLLSLITSISYDHMEYLGSTLTEIAREKCGILRPSVPLVCAANQPAEAMSEIQAACKAQNIPLILPDFSALAIGKELPGETEFTYKGQTYCLPQTGGHFAENAILALEAMDALDGAGFPLSKTHKAAGISTVLPMGRMQLVSKSPYILLDGAHNPDGIAKLAHVLDTVFAGRRLVTVMGMYKDKDYAACIPEIAKRSHVFLASSPEGQRALPPLAAMETAQAAVVGSMRGLAKGEAIVGLQKDAFKAALTGVRFLQSDEDVLLFCGSFGMLSAASEQLAFVLPNRTKYNIF